jgi:hypothetical protein
LRYAPFVFTGEILYFSCFVNICDLNRCLQRFEMALMKFTPGQVQTLLGLSPETFRQWKKVLPPLGERNGYRPCFSLGDLLAMALIKAMTDDAAIPVRAFEAISANLFDQCGRQGWASLERSVLLVELPSVRVEFLSEPSVPQLDRIGIVVSCRQIIAGLRERLLQDAEDPQQGHLRFAPTMVRGGAA